MSGAQVSAATRPQLVQPMSGVVIVRRRPSGPRANPQTPVSRDALRIAAVILEVLAGVRTPTEAAAAVSLSLPRYYLWEQRALEGLVRACEPRPKGKVASERQQLAVLEKEVARLRQDCTRQQALVRASQRTMGLAASPLATKPAIKPSGKATAKAGNAVAGKAKRKRRPVARALKAVTALQVASSQGETLADWSSAVAAEVVQRSAPNSSLAPAEAVSAAVAVSEA
jgi:hypothetical protein